MVWKVAAAVTVITAVLTVALGASFYISADGRRCRRPVLNRYARRTNQFREIDEDESYDNGWFVRELRCSKATFESVVLRVSSRWNEVNTPIHARAVFTIRERVALTLFHLASLEYDFFSLEYLLWSIDGSQSSWKRELNICRTISNIVANHGDN